MIFKHCCIQSADAIYHNKLFILLINYLHMIRRSEGLSNIPHNVAADIDRALYFGVIENYAEFDSENLYFDSKCMDIMPGPCKFPICDSQYFHSEGIVPSVEVSQKDLVERLFKCPEKYIFPGQDHSFIPSYKGYGRNVTLNPDGDRIYEIPSYCDLEQEGLPSIK